MSAQTCVVTIHRGDTWHPRVEPCGKPSKGTLRDGSPACGVHLRVEAKDAERADARAEHEQRKAAVNDALDIHCWGFDDMNIVSVRLDELEKLVAEFGGQGDR